MAKKSRRSFFESHNPVMKEEAFQKSAWEAGQAGLVIEKMTASQLDDLKAIDDAEKSAKADFDQHNAIKFSGQFHEAIIAITGNKILVEFMHNLISQSALIEAVYGSDQNNSSICQGHTELLVLMEAGKVLESQKWMDLHLHEVESNLDFSPQKADAINFAKVFF